MSLVGFKPNADLTFPACHIEWNVEDEIDVCKMLTLFQIQLSHLHIIDIHRCRRFLGLIAPQTTDEFIGFRGIVGVDFQLILKPSTLLCATILLVLCPSHIVPSCGVGCRLKSVCRLAVAVADDDMIAEAALLFLVLLLRVDIPIE